MKKHEKYLNIMMMIIIKLGETLNIYENKKDKMQVMRHQKKIDAG